MVLVIITTKKSEEIIVRADSSRELSRKYQIRTLSNKQSESALKEELTRKNMEIRKMKDSPLLEECNNDRRLLQEKIYELKRDLNRDLERIRSESVNSHTSVECNIMRDRIIILQNRNAKLEEQLHNAEKSQLGEGQMIEQLKNELYNLEEVIHQ